MKALKLEPDYKAPWLSGEFIQMIGVSFAGVFWLQLLLDMRLLESWELFLGCPYIEDLIGPLGF